MDPKCPVCAEPCHTVFAIAKDEEYRTTDETYAYLRCTSCQCVFLPSPPADKLDTIYPHNYYSFTDKPSFVQKCKEQLDRRLFTKILSHIPGETLQVLDIGGGTGRLLTLAKNCDARVTETHEVDIDENSHHAAESSGHTYHRMPIEEFNSEKTFDLIIMLNLIEHVADPVQVLAIAKKHLKEHGVILIKTPNTKTLDAALFRRSYWGGLHCPRHFVLFTASSLRKAAQTAGLHEAKLRYTQGAPQWTCSILSLLRRAKLITVSSEKPMHTHILYGPLAACFAVFDFLRSPFMRTAQMIVTLKHEQD